MKKAFKLIFGIIIVLCCQVYVYGDSIDNNVLAKAYYNMSKVQFENYTFGCKDYYEIEPPKFNDGVLGGKIDDYDNDGNLELLVLKLFNANESIDGRIIYAKAKLEMYEVNDNSCKLSAVTEGFNVIDSGSGEGGAECFLKNGYIVLECATQYSPFIDGTDHDINIYSYNGKDFVSEFSCNLAGSSKRPEDYTDEVNKLRSLGFSNTADYWAGNGDNKSFSPYFIFSGQAPHEYKFDDCSNLAMLEENTEIISALFIINYCYNEFESGVDHEDYIVENANMEIVLLDNTNIEYRLPEIKVIINNEEIEFDEPPYIENNVTLVPMRKIFEALGAEVNYDSNTKTVTTYKGSTVIELVTDVATASVNGNSITLSVPAMNKNGYIMVPIRFISEALGAEVTWDEDKRTIYIITDDEELNVYRNRIWSIYDTNRDFLFKDDKMLYKIMYNNLYVDSLGGHIVDKVAENITDNDADEEKYIEILLTLLTTSDMEFNSAVENQHEFDTDKSVLDYAYDVYDIISGSISPKAESASSVIKKFADGGKETVQITTNSLQKAKLIHNIGNIAECKINVLDGIYEHTNNEHLKCAVRKVKQGIADITVLELDIIINADDELSEYVGKEILLKDEMFPLLKETDLYNNDSNVKMVVDKTSELYDKASEKVDFFKTGAKLGLFAGDMILGTSDSINDVTTIKAVYEISQSLESDIIGEMSQLYNMNIGELYTLAAKYNFLTFVHLRGDYVTYDLIRNDMQLLSLILMDEWETLEESVNIEIQWLSQINEAFNTGIFIE